MPLPSLPHSAFGPATFWSSPHDDYDPSSPAAPSTASSSRSSFRKGRSAEGALAPPSSTSSGQAGDMVNQRNKKRQLTKGKQVPVAVATKTPSSGPSSSSSSTMALYPSSIYNDDLSSAPLYAAAHPARPTLPTISSPRVDAESSRSSSMAVDTDSLSGSSFDSAVSTDVDEDGEEYEYASSSEQDEERPFPSPKKALQDKYRRPAEESSPELSPSAPLDKGKGKKLSHAASWADPSLLPPTPSSLAAPVVSSTNASASALSSISNLNKISPFDAYYAPPASSLESPTDRFPRGRNPHPRLLWRSTLDAQALEILDAHHERVVGGPLPRLTSKVKLGASGVQREREHPGVRESGERGRSRSEKRWQAGRVGGARREWSVEGRKWSRAVEQCGL